MNRNEAWEYYKKWMKEETYSPALESQVYITRRGWDHLTRGSRNNRRSKADAHNKFSLLKMAKMIIKSSKEYSVENKEKIKYFVLENTQMFKGKKTFVKVLVREDSSKRKFFYSVMKK